MVVGAALRLWQHSGNPALDLDELALVCNIVEHPLRKLLFTPLLFAQVAPPGFLLTEKAVVFPLGDSEYALHLWPLLCSLASVVLCWRISLEVLQGLARPCALVLFAFKPAFVLYGATLKQYSTDTVAVLPVLLLAVKLGTHSATWLQLLLIGAIGIVVAHWSQAAVLALLGLGWASMVSALVERDMSCLRQLSLTISFWAVGASMAVMMGQQSMIILVLIPLYDTITNLPVYRREKIKLLLARVEARYLLGDAMYVYYGAWQAVSFYAARFGFRDHDYTIGGCHRGNTRAYLHELDQVHARPRLWVLIAHAMPGLQELPVIVGYLDRIGVRCDSVLIPAQIWDKKGAAPHLGDAYAYLYDLSDEVRLSLTTAETFAVASSAKPPFHVAFGCQAGPRVPMITEISR